MRTEIVITGNWNAENVVFCVMLVLERGGRIGDLTLYLSVKPVLTKKDFSRRRLLEQSAHSKSKKGARADASYKSLTGLRYIAASSNAMDRNDMIRIVLWRFTLGLGTLLVWGGCSLFLFLGDGKMRCMSHDKIE